MNPIRLLVSTPTNRIQCVERTNVSNSSLISLAIRYTPINPALILPKIKNLFQNFSQAEIAILSIDASSIRLESDPPFIYG